VQVFIDCHTDGKTWARDFCVLYRDPTCSATQPTPHPHQWVSASLHKGQYTLSHPYGPEVKNECGCRLRLKCDGTRAETRFRFSAKRRGPFKSAGASVQSTTGSRVVRITGSNAEYTMFRGSVKSTDYPLHSPVSPSLPLPCVTVCHHITTGLYFVAASSLTNAASLTEQYYCEICVIYYVLLIFMVGKTEIKITLGNLSVDGMVLLTRIKK